MLGLANTDITARSIPDALAKAALLPSNLLFFAGDNGYSHWGYFGRPRHEDDPLFKNKGPWPKGKFTSTHEGGVRVPFFVYWKYKIKAGENDHLCALYDVLATAADLAGVMPPKTDGISFAPTLLARTDEQLSHEYLYWENGTYSPHAQSVRMNQWWAYREHPSKPVMLYDISQDIDCRNDVARDHPDLINRIKQIFTESHTASEWYVNPGESKTQIAAKRKKAFASGGMQRSTGANTTYRGRTKPSPAGDVLKAAPDSAR